MPLRAPRYCTVPGCSQTGTYKGRCAQHARAQERTRYNAETRKWYCQEDWKVLRLSVLAEQPVCMDCHTAPSTKCDHIVPHRGDYALFWDKANLQGLCTTCHGRKTASGQ